jgi:hypothetical protein
MGVFHQYGVISQSYYHMVAALHGDPIKIKNKKKIIF